MIWHFVPDILPVQSAVSARDPCLYPQTLCFWISTSIYGAFFTRSFLFYLLRGIIFQLLLKNKSDEYVLLTGHYKVLRTESSNLSPVQGFTPCNGILHRQTIYLKRLGQQFTDSVSPHLCHALLTCLFAPGDNCT